MTQNQSIKADAKPNPAAPSWHSAGIEDVLKDLQVSLAGLQSEEAARRLETFGPNLIKRYRRDSVLVLIWRQINSPLIWVLLVSAVIAMALGKITDGAVVLAVVVINTIIGFLQEYKASRAIEGLVSMVPETAVVLRDNREFALPVAKLVPGDVVVLAAGDKVPADVRIVAAKNLNVDESALTGESVPVQKQVNPVEPSASLGDRRSMAYGGTMVTSGLGRALVVATGDKTELGRISSLLQETTDLETPLTKALAKVSKQISIVILLITAILLAIGIWRSLAAGVLLVEAVRETLIFAIALAVGAIPEGLPAIVTITLAIGVRRMAARQAIIRKLPAVETLGSTSVICSDKTGTLTKNEMTVQVLWTCDGMYEVDGVGYDPRGHFRCEDKPLTQIPRDLEQLLIEIVLCNDATLENASGKWQITGDPTEAALVVAAEKAGINVKELRSQIPRLDVIPFESENQFMATLHAGLQGTRGIILKGAPEVVLGKCSKQLGKHSFVPADILHKVERLAAKGRRVLAVAVKDFDPKAGELALADVESGFTFSGLVGMIDPPRLEVIESIRHCNRAGINVKMITGDHRVTAQAIGEQLGLLSGESALAGSELDALNDEQLSRAASRTNVFARVAPEHKLKLVRALQKQNKIVAMTGDGVNDAPALKQANIGVAMGITGTSVSKEAADVVLTDDNFASITAAVEEGRRVYDNLIKSLAFVLPTNLGLALILTFAILFLPFDPFSKLLLLPMDPTQILWINLVATVALALPLAFEAKEPNIMNRPPRDPSEPILNRFVLIRTVIGAVVMTGGALGLFGPEYFGAIARGVPVDIALAKAQTGAVTTVIIFQIFYMLNCRSLKDSILKIGLFTNKTVFAGAALILLLQGFFIYVPIMNRVFGSAPLGGREILISVLAGAIILPIIAVEKAWRNRAARSPNEAAVKLKQ